MNSFISKLSQAFLVAVTISGCVTAKVDRDVERNAHKLSKGPEKLPVRNITDFNESLRCMDNLFLSYGVGRGDYVLLIEDLKDKTKKVNAGTRQMMISAISDMTKRSGALRLITYGSDSGNLISFLNEAGKRGAYKNVPAFDIMGSISQFDDGIYKAQSDASSELSGVKKGSSLGLGGGKSSSSSVSYLTVDLSVLTAHNMSILPGVNTRNTVALFNRGTAHSTDAGISKLGMSYSFSKDSKDPMGQGLRGLIELSTIELIGKLVKLPYWNCLGMKPEHKDIQNEVSDWFFQLKSTGILHKTIKIQLYYRGFYKGKIDEKLTPDYLQAVMAYKQSVGLPVTQDVDLNFYSTLLNQTAITADRAKLAYAVDRDVRGAEKKKKIKKTKKIKRKAAKKQSAKVITEVANESTAISSGAEILEAVELTLKSNLASEQITIGDALSFKVNTNVSGFLNCYLQQGTSIVKLFPNRFSNGGYLAKQNVVNIPNSDAFSLIVEDVNEQLHCYLTPNDVSKQLPSSLNIPDFEEMPITEMQQLTDAYSNAANGYFGYENFIMSGSN